ncbi:diphthamide biosynthesis enzyme Dph2, partial [bacterium]
QMNLKAAEEAKKRIEKTGRTAHILVMDEIKPEKIEYINGIEAYINTACPRIGIEDRTLFRKPILNLDEAEGIL